MKPLNIRSRMLLAALLPLFLISTLLAAVFLTARFDDMQTAYEQRNRSVVRQMALASEYGLFSGNLQQLQALAAGALHEADVRQVLVMDSRGQTLASAGDGAQLPMPPLITSEQQGFDSQAQLDWLAQPVFPSDVPLDDLFARNSVGPEQVPIQLGQVVVVFSRHNVDARKRQMLATGGGIGILSLLFGMALAVFLSRGVIRPITRITQLVERIGRGDFAAVDKLHGQAAKQEPLHELQSHIRLMAERLALAQGALEQQVTLATQALREKKDEAEQANQAKSHFLAAASHDLRQPTHALGLFVSRLAQLPHDARTGELISHLDASVRAMQNLLDGLLDISRLEARAIQVSKRPFALAALFEQLQQDLSAEALDKGLTLRVRPTDLWVMSDATLIYRVLLNLVSNALRYTERGGVLVAARRCANKQVQLQVWDTGIGIAPQHQQAVFAEFYQVGNAARDRTKGMGLGLNIVQRTANLLDHPLTLSSRLGRGTCFSLSLPLATAELPVMQALPKDRQLADDVSGKWALVIEDDDLARTALVGLLESWGMRVAQAQGPAQALQRLAEGVLPDVIISDHRLQEGLSGLQLVQQLQQQLGRPTAACLMSGDTDPAVIQAVQVAGLTLLHKPVRPAKLRSLLRHLLMAQRDQRLTGEDRS
ncbi:ATP-binding protein [Rhodoferax antarcticus]|uniref:histidine kinase n=1 Tax=Rhodoferax antarcticus ANT.BR TaxID=1111071 RepID=A0A1Q8Y9W1_9BURK|nr:ATP-binding protein [Rhodoferax antarcticus]APW46957.1 hybrid sensor histidine kinase/response regulator [Rhodoferax antarcticus]OLP04802.1 Periplasmic sensor hybrid histidine kinase with HAMP domain [Rhodoferax antarcticus ANT.BR]